MVRWVAIIAARTRVHRGNEHERAGIFDGIFGARDGYFSVFEWLSQYFESGFVELWQLIRKQNAIVCQRDLARLGRCATANKGYFGDGMVRRTERTLRNERHSLAQLACNAVYLRGF